jgi:phospholipid/cholesterol/gamma-HCH transport system permease protein
VRWLSKMFEFVGRVGLFSLRVVVDSLRPPFEFAQLGRQLVEVGNKSLALIVVSGFALGAVMTLHTRSTLVMFGATAMIPAVQAVSFFVEIGSGAVACWPDRLRNRSGPCEHEGLRAD